MEDLRPQQIRLIGREEELKLLEGNLEDTIIGKGSTVLISGEAGVGKTRLVDEFLDHATDKGVKILTGASSSDTIHPFLTFSKALEKEIDDPLFQEQEHISFTALFAVDRSGILIAQASSEASDLDADIFAGMLSAVQDFVSDSFGMSGDRKIGLGRLEYGDMKIMIEHGSQIFLTAVFKGTEHPDMKNLLRSTVSSIEEECGEALRSWSGNMDDMAQVQETISSLANAKFLIRRDLEGVKLENERIRIADEVLELLRSLSTDRSLILLLEDLHWADESSLFVLNYISRNIAGENIMITGTLRPEMGDVLQTTMENMSLEDNFKLMPLIQLGSASVSSLVEAMHPGHQFPESFVKHLASACDGNPFFVIELLRQMSLEGNISTSEGKDILISQDYSIPDSVDEVVQRRLENLTPEIMALAEYASCIGRSFDSQTALSIQAARDPAQALQGLQDSGIITLNNGTAEFCHAIFQDVIYDGIGDRWKSSYHLSLGEYYETAYSENLDDVYYDLARHFFRSRKHDKAFTYCFGAGEKAENAFAIEQAISFYQNGLSLIPKLRQDPARSGKEMECLTRLGDLHTLIGETEIAIARYIEVIEKGTDPRKKADILRRIGEIHLNQGDYEHSKERADEGLALLDEEDSIETARLLSVLGWVGIRTGEHTEALASLEKALMIAEHCQDKREIANVKHNIGSIHLHRGDNEIAVQYTEEALKIRKEINDIRKISSSLNNLGNLYYSMGELAKAMEYYEQAIENSNQIRDKRSLSLLLTNIGNLHASLGDFDKSLECYNESYELKKRFGDKWGISTVLENIGTLHFDRGEFGPALDYYERSIQIRREIGDRSGVALSLNNIGELYHQTEEYEKAVEYYTQALQICKEIDELWIFSIINVRIADSFISLGQLDKAFSFANEALETSIRSKAKSDEARVRLIMGKAWLASGNMEKSFEEFKKARVIFEETEETGEIGRLYYEMSFYHRARGDDDTAAEYLQKALEIFKSMGFTLWLEKCVEAIEGA
ncbi:MAG: tetratricopeptide repeat protein [Thermoplasmata archaeon]|nr:tetratricopeptide repeat protein [Thermoplasmata archaeon]